MQEPQHPQAAPGYTAPVVPQSEGYAIHVSRLPKDLDERKLYEHCLSFVATINIISIRVCRDWSTHLSLGYAYVNVEKREDAVKLINLMNHTELGNTRLRVSWKRQGKLPAEANLFFSKLSSKTDVRRLEKLCSAYGEVASVDVKVYTETANGYVQFYTTECAQKAIEALNGREVDDSVLSVAVFVPKDQRQIKYTNIFVKNFEEGVDKDRLAEFFSRYGKITSVYIGRDANDQLKVKVHDDGVRTCYGFVNFSTHEEAVNAITEANGATFPGTEHSLSISVSRGLSKAERRQDYAKNRAPDYSRCLYISFINKDAPKEEIEQICRKFGKVLWFNLATDKDGKSLGFGYCYYETREECENAVKGLVNIDFRGSAGMKAEFYKTKAELVAERAVNRQPQPVIPYPGFVGMPPYIYPNPRGGYQKNAGGRSNRMQKRSFQQRTPQQQQQQPPQQIMPAQPIQQMQAPSRPNAPEHLVNIQPVSEAEFASLNDEDRHEVFGERIYSYMSEVHPDINPGKITGMVLESFKNNFEHLNAIIRNGAIVGKIAEAISVYQQHQPKKA